MNKTIKRFIILFILLNIIIFPVSALENYNLGFFSSNTFNHDTDKDGMLDSEEEIFGTDPYDANDNFDTLIANNEVAKGCFDLSPIFNGILKESEKDRLIQQLELYSVQEIKSLAGHDTQKIQSLFDSAGINVNETEYNGTGLASSVADSENIYFVQNGVSGVFIITDKQGVTSAFPLMAACSGTVIGIIYGAGMGVKDDITFAYSLVKGLWHYTTHVREIASIWGGVVNFIKSITWDAIESMFREVSLNIFKRGKDVLDYFGIDDITTGEYVSYQIGFYQGYVIGYVAEQIIVVDKIFDAIHSLKIGAKLGQKVSAAAEILARVTNKFGGNVADSLRDLRIWEKAMQWGDDVIDGMATILKYGAKTQADEVFEEYGERVAKAVYKSAGENMADTIRKAKEGVFSDEAIHIQKYSSVINHMENFGPNGRIFVGDPKFIDLTLIESSKTIRKEYLNEIVGIFGLRKEIGQSDKIAILKIKNVKSKFKVDTINGVPTQKYFDSPVGMPNTGSTIGGIPERVIDSLTLIDNPNIEIIEVIVK